MSARVFGRSGLYRLRHWYEAPGLTPGQPIDFRNDAAGALAFVRRLASDSAATDGFRALLAPEISTIYRLDDGEVLAALAARIVSGSILVERLPAAALPVRDIDESEPVEPATAPVPKKQEKTWIEIELLDTDGNPVPNERYWIMLPDGSTREGRLDDKGRAYFGELDPGECDVRFPDLDKEAVAAPGEPKKISWGKFTPRPRKTWIEIELIGMDGGPIPNETYRISIPGGEVREGKLDERGRARVDDLDPGTCTVTFPALDEEAWERR